MITLYGIPNCNTVKKAMDWLKANKQSYEFHDFKKLGVTPELLNDWFETFGWEKIVNKAGLTFKKLTPEEKEKINNESSARTYLQQNTSAIKRPVLVKNGKPVSIGFTEGVYEDIFK